MFWRVGGHRGIEHGRETISKMVSNPGEMDMQMKYVAAKQAVTHHQK